MPGEQEPPPYEVLAALVASLRRDAHRRAQSTCLSGDRSTGQRRELTVDSAQLRRDAGNRAWLLL